MSKEIPLTKGYVAIVDDEDFERLNQYKWCYSIYAERGIRKGNRVFHKKMHHLLLPPKDGFEIDHINGNKLDNRKENLRYVTRSQNMMNRMVSGKSSKYKGIYKDKDSNYYVAQIKANNKLQYYKRFSNEIEAAIAYNKNLEQYHGDYSLFNDVVLTDVDAKEIIENNLLKNKTIMKRIGNAIRTKRLSLNMFQEKLAEISNSDQCYISALELGKKKIEKDKLKRVFNSINLSFDDIVFNNQVVFSI